ncbi:MAG: GWxTD domain-containing protein [Bacteroidia bacterium]|nr:GWxTD domain-containing protein [Bacteroidia bacterium]
MFRPFFISLLLLAGLAILTSSTCTGGKGISDQNIAFIFNKEPGYLQPVYRVAHETEGVSRLYYRISADNLLYSKDATGEKYVARFSFSWKLKNDYADHLFIDSGTVVREDVFENDPSQILNGSFQLTIPAGKDLVLEIELYDINRMADRTDYLPVEKTNIYQRQNFFISNPGQPGIPAFIEHLQTRDTLVIRHRNNPEKLYVRYYNREFSLPPPPFSYFSPKGFEFRPDSFYAVTPGSDGRFIFTAPKPGIYHLQLDSGRIEGLTLVCFMPNYPRFRTYEAMIQPLRYLTSKNEYDKMMRNPNRKTAVDSFWLSSGGNIDRGKELIRKFYNRVYDANDHFTSYLEGWKTDRGLVYIVYGPPNVLYRNNDRETWVYGEENNINSLSFTFTRVINPFSGNDFRLERSPTYQDGWYKAANAWRDGRIFIDK